MQAQPAPMQSEEELATLRAIFDRFDADGSGQVSTAEFETILEALGRDPSDASRILSGVDPDRSGSLTFEEFVDVIRSADGAGTSADAEGADPKVVEFLKILEEYRLKCEEEGNYLEAAKASKQVETLRKQEERRQQRAVRAKQVAERQDIQIAHNMQYAEFNAAWDKYMHEYDEMAAMYIKQMDEKHAEQLKEFQQELHGELTRKPPKFSRELLDWRKRQHLLAKQGKYAEAQKIKKIADDLERTERMKMDENNLRVFQQKETQFRAKQRSELDALMKRIDSRRREHTKQRDADSKRLLQRNRNVQSVLETKQTVEAEKKKADIRSSLAPTRARGKARQPIDTGASARKSGRSGSSRRSGSSLNGSTGRR